MPQYDVRQLQRRLLDILVEFDRMCRAHGLRYCLCGGSLLGAVRHKGFIPWDDDLDVSMPRPDYERLIAHSRKWLPEHLEFVCAENDPKYPLPFGKIQDARTTLIERRHLYYLGGCYIDVFPFDAYPDNRALLLWQRVQYNWLKKCLYLVHRDPYRHGHGPACWLPLMVRRMYTMGGIQRRMRRVMTRYDYSKANVACSYTDGIRRIVPKTISDNYCEYEFEGHKVMGIRDYDPYLKAMYGPDYMTPPPEKDRFQHLFDYLDLDHPYRDYSPDRELPEASKNPPRQ